MAMKTHNYAIAYQGLRFENASHYGHVYQWPLIADEAPFCEAIPITCCISP